jgi:hypothetical protein
VRQKARECFSCGEWIISRSAAHDQCIEDVFLIYDVLPKELICYKYGVRLREAPFFLYDAGLEEVTLLKSQVVKHAFWMSRRPMV